MPFGAYFVQMDSPKVNKDNQFTESFRMTDDNNNTNMIHRDKGIWKTEVFIVDLIALL